MRIDKYIELLEKENDELRERAERAETFIHLGAEMFQERSWNGKTTKEIKKAFMDRKKKLNE